MVSTPTPMGRKPVPNALPTGSRRGARRPRCIRGGVFEDRMGPDVMKQDMMQHEKMGYMAM